MISSERPAAPPCAAHPQQLAVWYCPTCEQGLCRGCANTYVAGETTFAACQACGTRCDRIGGEPWRPENDRSSFLRRLPRALIAPLRATGWITVIIGGFVLAIVAILSSLNIFGFIFMMLIFGFLAAYAINSVEEAAGGALGLSDWPGLDDFWGDIVVPLVQLGGVTAVSFAPAMLYRTLVGADGVHIALFVAGFIYYPMGLLAVVMWRTINGLSPLIVLPAMRATALDYLLLCVIIAGIEASRVWLNTLVDRTIAGTMLGGVLWVYLVLMQAWLLGAFYHANRFRIGWFERDADDGEESAELAPASQRAAGDL